MSGFTMSGFTEREVYESNNWSNKGYRFFEATGEFRAPKPKEFYYTEPYGVLKCLGPGDYPPMKILKPVITGTE